MSLLSLAAAVVLGTTAVPLAEPARAAAQPAAPQRSGPSASEAQDRDIQLALMELYRTDPQRKVCVERTLTGSRQRRAICGTVASWFNARLPHEIAANDPPYQLVEEIKRQRTKASFRQGQSG
jgi:hypothetical protein